MIAVVPPLWAILIVLLIVGAAALFVVVCGLLWIWGRGEGEAPARDYGITFPAELGPAPAWTFPTWACRSRPFDREID